MATAGTVREMVTRVSVEELTSHLATLEAELSDGRLIELVRGETVIAEVRAKDMNQASVAAELPDFMGRLRANWGDTVLPLGTGTALVREDRDSRG